MRLPQLLAATKGMDGVLHLAALMSLTMDRDPWTGIDVNIRGTQNVDRGLLHQRREASWCSPPPTPSTAMDPASSATWSRPRRSIPPARRRPPSSTAPARSSASSSAATRTCKRGLDYVVLRYSTVYGERQHYRAANALYIIETHDRVRRGERPQRDRRRLGDQAFRARQRRRPCQRGGIRLDATDVAVNISGPAPVTTLEIVRLVTELAGKDLGARAHRARPGQGAAHLRRRLAHRSPRGRAGHRLAAADGNARRHPAG